MGFVVAHRSNFQFSEAKFAAQIIVQKIRRWRFPFHIRLGRNNLCAGHHDLHAFKSATAFKSDIISPKAVLELQALKILQEAFSLSPTKDRTPLISNALVFWDALIPRSIWA
jgi:hypothetical protein